MNKKRLIFILAGVLILLALLIGYSVYSSTKNDNKIKNLSMDFVGRWANFDDRYSEKYYNSIKPFLTEDLSKQYNDDVIQVGETNKKYGIKPTSSVFNNTHVLSIKKSGKDYQVQISGDLKYSFEKSSSKKVANIKLINKNKNWLVQEAYFED